jgi:uncharacterized protein YodC (DUF2158 family)
MFTGVPRPVTMTFLAVATFGVTLTPRVACAASLQHPRWQSRLYRPINHNARPLQVGDRVRIRSGGPPMMIESIRDDEATWVWFNDAQEAILDTFFISTLTPVEGITPR